MALLDALAVAAEPVANSIAEAALLNRWESLDHESDSFQRTEIEIALSKLRLLKREILNF